MATRKYDSQQRRVQRLVAHLHRHWLVALCCAFFAVALLAGAPAWAAPSPRPLNQTVPRPTPTDSGDPLATATPRADDDDDSSGDEGGDIGGDEGGSGDPLDLFPDNPEAPSEGDGDPATGGGGVGSAPGANLTASTTVDGLNLREGPSTDFNVLGNLPANTQVTVVSRNDDGSWWYVCCLPGSETAGWVSAQLLTPTFVREEADTLLPVFGATIPTPMPRSTPQATQVAPAGEPLQLGFEIDPPFVWQGITATLTITIANPNPVDIVDVELSDELPPALQFIEATADGDGEVENMAEEGAAPLLLFRWPVIPAETSVSASVVVTVSRELEAGAVVDNLVAVRADNAAYSTGAVTIGLPPVSPPTFE